MARGRTGPGRSASNDNDDDDDARHPCCGVLDFTLHISTRYPTDNRGGPDGGPLIRSQHRPTARHSDSRTRRAWGLRAQIRASCRALRGNSTPRSFHARHPAMHCTCAARDCEVVGLWRHGFPPTLFPIYATTLSSARASHDEREGSVSQPSFHEAPWRDHYGVVVSSGSYFNHAAQGYLAPPHDLLPQKELYILRIGNKKHAPIHMGTYRLADSSS
jgi:hypothetical protein